MRSYLLALAGLLFACNSQATVYYVDAARPDNSGAGTSWNTAKKDVQDAINSATTDGDEVWVKAGLYLPTQMFGGSGSRSKTFFLVTADIKLYGGFTGTETAAGQRNPLTNLTTLSGFLDGNNSANNAYHVLRTLNRTSACIVDGFTVQDAKTDLTGASDNSYGGGMYNGGASFSMSSNPTVSNCIFFRNYGVYGAGMCNNTGSSPTVINCTFNGNVATSVNFIPGNPNPVVGVGDGAGIYNESSANATVTNCTFSNNSGEGIYSAGSSPVVSNCTFSNNFNSGMFNTGGNPVISKCVFTGNLVNSPFIGGGGIRNFSSSATIVNCTFNGNSAGNVGGSIYTTSFDPLISPTITNCTFINNSSLNGGSGIRNDNSCAPVISNCTFYGNRATANSAMGAGISYATGAGGNISNCIFSNNSTPNNAGNANQKSIYKAGTSGLLTVDYSIVDDYSSAATNNYASGNGIITSDPAFVNTANPIGADGIWGTADDGLGITCSSPATDAGDPAATTPATDIIGNPRKGIMDMGAWEAAGGSTASNTIPAMNTAVSNVQTAASLSYTDCINEVLKINATGQTWSGSTIARVFVQSSVLSANGQLYVRRHYDVSPAVNPNTATATVTLYFSQSDFTDYNANRGSFPSLPVDGTDATNYKANLRITQQHGSSASGIPDSYTGWAGSSAANAVIIPTAVSYNNTAARWEVTFPVTGFSGFFANSGCPVGTNPGMTVTPAYPMSGQKLQTILLGYPGSAQQEQILLNPPGGTANYTYAWQQSSCNGDTTTLTPLAGTNSQTTGYTFSPVAGQLCNANSDNIFIISVTATDGNGCKTTQTKKIDVINVYTDASKTNVQICHKVAVRGGNVTQLMIVPAAQVATHLSHGDALGSCAAFTGAKSNPDIIEEQRVAVYPNPATDLVILELSAINQQAEIMITDIQGRVVASRIVGKDALPVVSFDLSNFARGLYLLQLRDGDFSYHTKLMVR